MVYVLRANLATGYAMRKMHFTGCLRLLHGLSHKKMGGIVGVDGATISTWETGKFMPDGANLNRLNAIPSE